MRRVINNSSMCSFGLPLLPFLFGRINPLVGFTRNVSERRSLASWRATLHRSLYLCIYERHEGWK